MSVNFFGFFKNCTISSNSSFSSSTPATSSNDTLFLSAGVIILALLFPNDSVFPPVWFELIPPIMKNQNIINIINSPNGVSKLSIVMNIDSDFSSNVNAPFFMKSSVYVMKLPISGIFTSFFTLSSESSTVAVLPSASISIASTFPSFIFVINSEYFNFVLEFSIIDDNTIMKIIPIINHIASVFILFFKLNSSYLIFHNLFYENFISFCSFLLFCSIC